MGNYSFEQLQFNALKNGQSTKTLYDLWLSLGNTGGPEQFLDSLKGTTAIIVTNVTIPVSAWVLANGVYVATIANEDIKSTNVVNVNFTSASINTAINYGILGYTNSIDGGFEMYANFQPTADLVINYAIIRH